MEQTRPLFTSYLRIRSLSTATTSPELSSARSDLESALGSLAEDLADLVESVRVVEENPAQYGLSVHEVQRRKRLVQEIGGEVEDMREELNKHNSLSSPTSGGPNPRRTGGAAAGSGGSDLPDPAAFAIPGGGEGGVEGEGGGNDDEDYTAEFEQRQQMAMMREQDQNLDGVFQTVGNLRRMADDMGREMEEQVEMLDVTDGLADRVGGRLQTGMDKLRYVMRHNEDTLSSWCIGLLILVLCILLVLLLIL